MFIKLIKWYQRTKEYVIKTYLLHCEQLIRSSYNPAIIRLQNPVYWRYSVKVVFLKKPLNVIYIFYFKSVTVLASVFFRSCLNIKTSLADPIGHL